MPIPYQLDIGNLPSVGASIKTQLQIPRYGRLWGLMLQFNNAGTVLTDLQLAVDVSLIRLVADGNEIHSVSGRDLLVYLNRQFGPFANGSIYSTPNANGTLFLPMANLAYSDYVNQTATAMGLADVQNIFLEVTFSGAITSTACAVSMMCDLVAAPWSQYFSIATFPQTLVAGVNEIQQLPKEADVNILQYMAINTNAGAVTLDRFEVLVNSTPVLQLPRALTRVKEALMKKASQIPCVGTGAGLTALDAFFMDFNPTNDLATALPLNGITDQRLKLTYTNAAGAMNIVRFANRNRKAK